MEINDIIELKGQMDSYHGQRDKNFDTLTNYYEQNITFENMPSDVTVHRSPAARKQVDAALAHWMALNEKVTMPVYRETERTKTLVSQLIQYGDAYIKYVNTRQMNLRRICGKHGFLYGTYAIKAPLYLPRMRPTQRDGEGKEEFKKREESWEKSLDESFPIIHRAVHPKNLLWDSLDNPSFIFEKYTRKSVSIKREWGDKFDDSKVKPGDNVNWWEYWDNEMFAFFVDTDMIETGENIYGYIPYVLGDAGFGLEGEDSKPEVRLAGLIAPALSAFHTEMRVITAIVNGIEYGVWGKQSVEQEPDDSLQISNKPGELSVIPKQFGYKIEPSPTVIKDAYAMLDICRNEQEMITPKSIMGVSEKYTSGYANAIEVGEAKLGFGGMVESWEKTWSTILDRSLYLIKNVIMEPVGLTGNYSGKSVLTIKPDQIDTDTQHFYVVLDATTPEEKDRRIMLGLRMQMSGAASYETICREFYGLDPNVETTRKMIEAALQSPMIQQAVAMEALNDAGMQQILDLIKQGQIQPPQPQGQPENFRNSDYTRTQMRESPQMAETQPSTLQVGNGDYA